MAKLGDFQTPTGQRGNLLSPKTWLGLILGALALMISFGVASVLYGKVKRAVPGANNWLGSGTPFTRDTENGTKAPTAPALRIYS